MLLIFSEKEILVKLQSYTCIDIQV